MRVRGTNTCCTVKNAHKYGFFKRKSDSQKLQRYRCKTCGKSFSPATHSLLKWQKKRYINQQLLELFCLHATMAKATRFFRVNPKTIAKKLAFLGMVCRKKMAEEMAAYGPVTTIQFDELQTFEHTKCKPLSVAMAVSKKERKILGFAVSIMPATGHLSAISRKKYGKRPDNRRQGMRALFEHLATHLSPKIAIASDECTYYAPIVRQFFPQANYVQYKGKKGCVTGHGELKKTRFDPIFSINHTFAMLRGSISRLIRRTWCTTKKISALEDHISIYAWYHNNIATPDLVTLTES